MASSTTSTDSRAPLIIDFVTNIGFDEQVIHATNWLNFAAETGVFSLYTPSPYIVVVFTSRWRTDWHRCRVYWSGRRVYWIPCSTILAEFESVKFSLAKGTTPFDRRAPSIIKLVTNKRLNKQVIPAFDRFACTSKTSVFSFYTSNPCLVVFFASRRRINWRWSWVNWSGRRINRNWNKTRWSWRRSLHCWSWFLLRWAWRRWKRRPQKLGSM